MLRLPVDRARSLCLDSLTHVGFTQQEAEDTTNAIMFATLRGLDTHGIISILPAQINGVVSGSITPNAEIRTLRESPISAVYQGNGAAGPVIGSHAMRAAINKAREHGLGLTTAVYARHFGAASAYAAMAAPEGMIGLVMCNAQAVVAPFGGADALHGTNPLAYAAPGGTAPPFVLDIATSAAAHGQVFKALRRGQEIPLGWALDKDGRPTTDPKAAVEGVMLPFGAHKGYGIGVLVDILTGALTGSTIGRSVQQGNPDPNVGGQAFFHLAINISFFTELETFTARIDELYNDIKAIRPAEGFTEVFAPGELEWREEQRRLEQGIPLYEADWEALSAGLAKGGVPREIIDAHAPDAG